MAIKIEWSFEADETFTRNINYLEREWNDNEVRKFVAQTQNTLERIKIFPESYPSGSKNKKYRKARLNKYTVLFYRYYKSKNVVILVSFWNVKQNPDKLIY